MKRVSVIVACILALSLVAVLGVGCGGGETGFYFVTAVVAAEGPGELSLPNDGTSKEIDVKLKETAGKDVKIEAVQWEIRNQDGDWLSGDTNSFVPPKEIKGNKEITVSFYISYKGTETGTCYLKCVADGYDTKRGVEISAIPGSSEVLLK
jgi:hypothetical protein